jgi:hypothetical protein
VARDAAGKAELLEEALNPLRILRHCVVVLGVRAFEIGVGDEPRSTVARAREIDHVEVVRLDHAVQVRVDEIQPRRRAPVAEQPRLDVRAFEALRQQRVVEQVDLADG